MITADAADQDLKEIAEGQEAFDDMMDDILDEDNPCKVDCLKCNGDACNGTGVVIY
jgi:hypothetical protein